MKLASLKHGRDGRLVVVSDDLTRATDAFPVVSTLQAALDDWERHAPRLADLAESLEHGSVPSFRFHEHDCAAPLPRAFARLEAGALADGLRRCGSDSNLGPREAVHLRSEDDGIGFEARIAVVTGDVPTGVAATATLAHIRLVMFANDMKLQNRIAKDGTQAPDLIQDAPFSAYSPVVVTPDTLGQVWREGRLHGPLLSFVNGKPSGSPGAGADAATDFGALIARAAAMRPLSAGTIIVAQGGSGVGRTGTAATPFLRFGDIVRVEVKDAAGHSLFGAIEQEILPGA